MGIKKIEVKMEQRGLEMEVNKEDFAMALKTWRLRNDLTQEQAGKKMGVSRYTIIRAERAKNISWEHAYKLFARLAAFLKEEGE